MKKTILTAAVLFVVSGSWCQWATDSVHIARAGIPIAAIKTSYCLAHRAETRGMYLTCNQTCISMELFRNRELKLNLRKRATMHISAAESMDTSQIRSTAGTSMCTTEQRVHGLCLISHSQEALVQPQRPEIKCFCRRHRTAGRKWARISL